MIQASNDPIVGLLGSWASDINLWSILLRIAASAVLSAMIGTERSSKRHSAGLRTFMLVSLAGTAAMLVDLWLFTRLRAGLFLLSVAAVVSTTMIATNSLFISSRNQIKGITTSAGLLLCCFLGVSLGAGLQQHGHLRAGAADLPGKVVAGKVGGDHLQPPLRRGGHECKENQRHEQQRSFHHMDQPHFEI